MARHRTSYYFRSALFRVSLFILTLLAAFIFRYLSFAKPSLAYLFGLLYSFFFIGCILYWEILAEHRVVHQETLNLIKKIVLMTLFLHLVSMARLDHYEGIGDATRFLWYLYYIPFNFIPLLTFLMMLTVGKKEGESFDPKWRFLYLAATILSLLFITNDKHQLAFVFPEGLEKGEIIFRDGIVYFISAAWAIPLMFIAMIGLIRKGKSLVVQTKGWIVFIPLSLIVINSIFVGLSNRLGFGRVYQVLNITDTMIFFLLLMLEMSIEIGLIPSNSHYQDFFETSTLSCQIVDEEGHVRFCSDSTLQQKALTDDQKVNALKHPLFLDENTMLWGQKIRGGASYWTSNVSEITALLTSLRELSDSLTEENTMIQAENKLVEESIRIEEMNRLYDQMLSGIRPTLFKIDVLLAGLKADSPDFDERIKQVAVYGAYVKRRCNLTILADGVSRLSLKEIEIAIQESLHYIELLEIHGSIVSDTTAAVPVSTARLFFETYESLVETFLTQMDSILVSFRNDWEMRVVVETNGEFPPALGKEIRQHGEYFYEDGAWIVTVREGAII